MYVTGTAANALTHVFSPGDSPDGMANAVRRGEIVQRRFLDFCVHQRGHGFLVAIGEKHRPGVGAECID